jgi:hypothetical protein
MTSSPHVITWSQNNLHVRVSLTPAGELQFHGHDLKPPPLFGESDYEYTLTVASDDIPTVVAALGGAVGDDVMPLIEANIETIVRTGEKTWLTSIHVAPRFWSYP